MVVPPWMRDRAAVASLVLVAILCVPPVSVASGPVPVPTSPTPVPTPPVDTPPISSGAAPNLTIHQGSLQVVQAGNSGDVDSPFTLANASGTERIKFTILNTGGAATDIGVFVFPDFDQVIPEKTDTTPGWTRGPGGDISCRTVTVPAQKTDNGVTTPGSLAVDIPIIWPSANYPAGFTNVTTKVPEHSAVYRVLVNNLTGSIGAPGTCRGSSGQKAYNTASSGASPNREVDLTDNVAFVRITRDAQLDHHVESVRWCRGGATDADDNGDLNGGKCNDWDFGEAHVNWSLGAGKAWNLQRNVFDRPCTAITDNDPTTPPWDCPVVPTNSTYFNVTISTTGILDQDRTVWQPLPRDLQDYGSSSCRLTYQLKPTTPGDDPTPTDDPPTYVRGTSGLTTGTPDPTYVLNDPAAIKLHRETCGSYDLGLSIKASPADANPTTMHAFDIANASWGSTDDTRNAFLSGAYHSVNMSLTNTAAVAPRVFGAMTGQWDVTVKLNSTGKLREADTTNDAAVTKTIEILAPDFAATSIGLDHGSSATDPVRYTSTSPTVPTFRASATFKNLGTAASWSFTDNTPTLAAKPVNISFIIDNNTGLMYPPFGSSDTSYPLFHWSGAGAAGEVPSVTVEAPFTGLSTEPGTDNYIGVGPHWICAVINPIQEIDSPGTTNYHANETDDTNNKSCMALILDDGTVPQITPITIPGSSVAPTPRITDGSFDKDALASVRAGTEIHFHANVTYSNQPALNVTFIATLLNGTQPTNTTRTYYPCPGDAYHDPLSGLTNCVHNRTGTQTGYSATIRNFTFANKTSANENWSISVHAYDGIRSDINQSTSFQIRQWPIQTREANITLLGLCKDPSASTVKGQPSHCTSFYNNTERIPYAGHLPLVYALNLTSDSLTGMHDQWNNTTNLAFNVTLPGGLTRHFGGDDGAWHNLNLTCIDSSGTIGLPSKTDSSTTKICPDYGYLESLDLTGVLEYDQVKHTGGPGIYNFSAQITDAAGQVRAINSTFDIFDAPPRLSDWKRDAPDIAPGTDLHVHVNVTDDFSLNATFVNFTRVGDNLTFSFPLINSTTLSPPSDQLVGLQYNDTITTGHGKTLGVGGEYKMSFWALDSFGNWNGSDPLSFKLNDTTAPTISDVGISREQAEANSNVTFHATATDATNVTVLLQVLLGSEEVLRANMTEDKENLGAFNYTTNFTREGSYTYNVWAIDSVNLESAHLSKTFSIADNLAPAFEIKAPSTVIGNVRYAKAAPEIRVLVYDSSNVSLDSITLSVGGITLPPSEWAHDGSRDPKGILVTYFVPASAKFNHGDVVDVWMNATDLSNQSLAAEPFHFNFTVDDRAPTTTVKDFSPKARDNDRNVWNISVDTSFTLAAADDDGLPNGAPQILYQVCPLLCSGVPVGQPYQAAFKLRGNPAYTGPRIYEIDYWSVDDVGNTNRSPERLLAYVDDLPPFLDPFGSVPQGRFVNASFGDDRSGVASAAVWWRVNGQVYQPVALTPTGGVWSTVLPEGKKGDTMQYYLQATDKVGNVAFFGNATNPYSTFLVGNHLPSLKITSPADGSKLQRQVELKWDANDEDGDTLSFDILYKAPGKSSYVELQKLESPDVRAYVLDTTRLADGQYTFRVTASDQSFVAVSEITVTIQNSATAILPPPPLPGEVAPGDPVLITAQITKANAEVEALIYRDGKFVNKYAMNDEGLDGDKTANDHIYSVTVRFDASGAYSVEIHTRYQEDGQLKESSLPDAGAFTVKLTPAGIFNQFGPALVVIGLLAVAGIGVAAWVLIRRR